ncbi:hypothetical protein WISP_82112 [Willisornis vidua]|uniref:RNA-directed DNA polymerase n=1 Tax=Willisornis vidua TaxID=1566151 RepID=A0ABQ9DA63_9PASS|nr:hypothetical protein WISP_82112 [Willisornis vidua]
MLIPVRPSRTPFNTSPSKERPVLGKRQPERSGQRDDTKCLPPAVQQVVVPPADNPRGGTLPSGDKLGLAAAQPQCLDKEDCHTVLMVTTKQLDNLKGTFLVMCTVQASDMGLVVVPALLTVANASNFSVFIKPSFYLMELLPEDTVAQLIPLENKQCNKGSVQVACTQTLTMERPMLACSVVFPNLGLWIQLNGLLDTGADINIWLRGWPTITPSTDIRGVGGVQIPKQSVFPLLIHGPEGVVSRIENSYLKDLSNKQLFHMFSTLFNVIQCREHPFFIQHIRSHMDLPGLLVEGNRVADQAADSAVMVNVAPIPNHFEKAQISHKFFHQSAKALQRDYHLSASQARDIMSACPDCQKAWLLLSGLQPGTLRAYLKSDRKEHDSWQPFNIKFPSPESSHRLCRIREKDNALDSSAWSCPAGDPKGRWEPLGIYFT